MDQVVLLQLLQGAINQTEQIRKESLGQLDSVLKQPNDMISLLQLVAEKNQLAEIYLNYWIQQYFEQLDPQNKQHLKSLITQIYLQNKGDQMKKAIKGLVLLEPIDLSILQWLVQIQDIDLTYYVLKEIHKQEGDTNRIKELCKVGLNLINNNSLETSLKLIILSQRILNDQKVDKLQFDQQVQELGKILHSNEGNARIAYLLQKVILSKLTYGKDIPLDSLTKLLKVLDQAYFSNSSLRQLQIQFQSKEQFESDLQKFKDVPNKQNQLVLQILKILKLLLQNHTYDPLLVFEQTSTTSLEFELILFEGYFDKILRFLTNYSLLLSPQQVYDIYYDSEEAYAENNNAAYEIRDTTIDFLMASLQSHKADEVAALITLEFGYAPELTSFNNILRKEAIYFLIRNVMLDMQFDMDQYIDQFQAEMNQQDALFDPLKIQILQIFIKYLKHSESVPENIVQIIIKLVLGLQTQNLCIILLQIECLGQLIELMEQPSQFWPNIQSLYPQFKNEESKICIFNFYAQLTKKDQFTDHSWILEKFHYEWQQNNISIQEKILETLLEILFRNDNLHLHLNTCIYLLQQTFTIQQQILTEIGTEVLLMLFSKCSQLKINMPQEWIIFVQNLLKTQLCSQTEFWTQSILLQTYILNTKAFNEQLLQETLLIQIQQYQEIKEEAYENIFIPVFIYAQMNPKQQEFCHLIYQFLIKQQLSGVLLIKLGNYLSLTSDIQIPDAVNAQILQAHLLNKNFQLEYFKNFIYLLQRSQSTFLSHCQEIYEEQSKKELESNKNYIVSDLRPLLGNRRLRMPQWIV